MIYITGDTHGDIDVSKLSKLSNLKLTYSDTLIILGDCGICFIPSHFKSYLFIYQKVGCTIIFLDGNHENFDMLNGFPIKEIYGAKVHQIDEHIFHVLRGEILNIEGNTCLCIGGAHSIDKMYRIEGISWWQEEDITKKDIDNALDNLKKYNNKVDFVFTHCTDSKTVQKAFGFETDNSTSQLQFIDLLVDYKYWLFGHYHFDVTISDKKKCLYQEIYYIKDKALIKL